MQIRANELRFSILARATSHEPIRHMMNAPDPERSIPPQDQETAAALKLWVILNRAHRAVAEHSRRDLERHGLAPSEFAVLELLYHRGSMPLGEVSERVLLTSGSTTYVVDKLEKRGLLRRALTADDRRVILAALTDEGRELIARIFPTHAEAIRRATEGLSLDEKRTGTALLRRLGRYAADSG